MMYSYNFTLRNINKLILKKKNFKRKEKNNIFFKILRLNKKNNKYFFYKLKRNFKNYFSISKQINVCVTTGKYKSIINVSNQKRHIFKDFLNSKKISFIKKK